VKAEPRDLAWARRQLALSYAARGTYRDLQNAERLIEKNRAGELASTADLQLLAQLYAFDPNRARRGESMGVLEDMLKRQSATQNDRFLLAQIYLREGQWTKASAHLRTLIAESDTEPRYLIAYIEALLQHGETSDVEGYLNRLMKMTSNGFEAFRLQADLLYAAKRPQEALDLLTNFVDRNDVEPKDRNERSRMVAIKLADLGRQLAKSDQKLLAERFTRQAGMLYRAYNEQKPGQKLRLAMFLSGLGPDKINESLDLLDQGMNESTPSAFGQACDVVLQSIVADEEKWKRLDQLVEKGLKKFERPNSLLLVMADSYTRQSRYTDAETYYREVIKRNPKDAQAMNNLAFLLALQGVKLDEALKFSDQAVEILGPLGAVLDSRGCVYIAMRNPDKALKDLDESLADRETPLRYFHQAQAYTLAGQQNSARTAMFKALQMGLTKDMLQPPEVPAYDKLNQLLKR
jgi:cellulose synthase operon protein C